MTRYKVSEQLEHSTEEPSYAILDTYADDDSAWIASVWNGDGHGRAQADYICRLLNENPMSLPAPMCRLCGHGAELYCGVCGEPVCHGCTGEGTFPDAVLCGDHCEDCYGGTATCEEHT